MNYLLNKLFKQTFISILGVSASSSVSKFFKSDILKHFSKELHSYITQPQDLF